MKRSFGTGFRCCASAKGQAEDIEVAAGDIIFVPERLF